MVTVITTIQPARTIPPFKLPIKDTKGRGKVNQGSKELGKTIFEIKIDKIVKKLNNYNNFS